MVDRELAELQAEAAAQLQGEDGLPAMKASVEKLAAKRRSYQTEAAKYKVRLPAIAMSVSSHALAVAGAVGS